MELLNRITSIVDTGLITTVITEGVSIAGLASGIALSGTSLIFSVQTSATRKSFKIFTKKQEKHDVIKVLAQSKLDSIADIISQAMQDGDYEFHEFL